MPKAGSANRYSAIIERVFLMSYHEGDTSVTFSREELLHAAAEAGLQPPKNIGDLVYSFRYRYELPAAVPGRAPEGLKWVIRPAGKALYRFVAVAEPLIVPNPALLTTKVPDGTPGAHLSTGCRPVRRRRSACDVRARVQ